MPVTPCEVEPNLWFSDEEDQQQRAVAGCYSCLLRQACAERAPLEEYGIWGGVKGYGQDTRPSAYRMDRGSLIDRVMSLSRDKDMSARKISLIMGISPRTVVRYRREGEARRAADSTQG